LLLVVIVSTYFHLTLKASNILKEEKKRKAVEKTLIESEKRFRVMFELSPAGIILIDEQGKVIEVNTAFCVNLGYSRKDVIGNNISLFTDPERQGDILKNISEILSGKTIIHEVENIRKDGTLCTVALYETMIILPDGTSGILTVSNDITEKKRSQERMLTLSRALESIGECVSITDFENKLIFVNNAFCRCYGYSEEEVIGKNISITRPRVNNDLPWDKILQDTLSHGWNGELTNVRKDGSEFPIELSTSCIKDEKGNTVALIGIAVDITERKRIQTELIKAKDKAEESDKLKSAFLANMSHELRTPLNAIIGFSGLINEWGPGDNTIPYSQIIMKSGQHLLTLVEDIFDITMIESGQTKIKYEKTEIISLLQEVRDIISGERITEEKTSVKLNLKPDLTRNQKYLVTDPVKLKQVLMNLLRNALKFTEQGFIEFGFDEITENDIRSLRFYVKDTGIGIDKTYHEVIFNIFRQIDDTNTRKVGGMGIGLSIAKKTVEMLGGRIWVESEPEKGSTFYFTIPETDNRNDKTKISEKNAPIMEKKYNGKTILIAEDEQSNFDFLKILFNRMDIRVLWAKDGNEAVNLCESDSKIDLVLMDIKMPFLNGFEATRLIKIKHPDLPIIAQTAYAMNTDKTEATKAGCDGYLTKPLKLGQITEVLETYL
jgi:PAS domain S-box-containing protein